MKNEINKTCVYYIFRHLLTLEITSLNELRIQFEGNNHSQRNFIYHFPQWFAQLDQILWVSNTIYPSYRQFYPVNKKRNSCVIYESGCVTCSFLVIKTENASQCTTWHVVCFMTYSRTASFKFHWLCYTIKTSLVIREYCFFRYFTNFLAEDIGLEDLYFGYIIKRYYTRFKMIYK